MAAVDLSKNLWDALVSLAQTEDNDELLEGSRQISHRPVVLLGECASPERLSVDQYAVQQRHRNYVVGLAKNLKSGRNCVKNSSKQTIWKKMIMPCNPEQRGKDSHINGL